MCCCSKPNVNGTPGYSWDGKATYTRPIDPPTLGDDDRLVADEPGRCGGLDSHSHHFVLVRSYGSLSLLVRHGGGDERIRVSLPDASALLSLDSNARYWILLSIYAAHSEGEAKGSLATHEKFTKAFIENRLRKRKSPGRNYHKVWIEPARSAIVAT